MGAAMLMESAFWYREATLILGTRLVRAGTLIQCARRWHTMPPQDQAQAELRLAEPLDGITRMAGNEIASLATRPGFRFA